MDRDYTTKVDLPSVITGESYKGLRGVPRCHSGGSINHEEKEHGCETTNSRVVGMREHHSTVVARLL